MASKKTADKHKQEFVDQLVIQLLVRGYPEASAFQESERLWLVREKFYSQP